MSNETVFISWWTSMFLKLIQGHFTSAVGSRQCNFPAISLGVAQAFFHFTFLIYLNKFLCTLIFPSFCVLIASFSPAHSQDSLNSEDTVLNFSHWNCSPPRRWKCNIASPPPPLSLPRLHLEFLGNWWLAVDGFKDNAGFPFLRLALSCTLGLPLCACCQSWTHTNNVSWAVVLTFFIFILSWLYICRDLKW